MTEPAPVSAPAGAPGPAGAPEPVLEIESLELCYGALPVVRDLNMVINRGEVVGVVGPNGAGKTSTTLAVMGVIAPSKGEIRFEGRSLKGRATEGIVRGGVSLVPEGRHIFADLTVAENLRLGLVGRGTPEGVDEDLERIHTLFPIVYEFRARQAGTLSGGQQQQLAIARALLAKPRMLLLDEPSLGLSPTVVDTVWGALEEIRRGGVTILLVEQRAQITVDFADRTYVMSGGSIRMELTPADATNTDRMVAAYFGS